MGQYLSPGVYVEEKSSGVKPIEGAGTSTGAFVGIAEKGPMGKAELIANWTQFVSKFGGYIANGYLAYALNQFFSQGGTRCYVVRTCHYENITKATSKSSRSSAGTLNDKDNNPTMKITASSDGKWGDSVSVEVKEPTKPELKATGTSEAKGFKLVVKYNSEEVEILDDLTIDDAEDIINSTSAYILVETDGWNEKGTDITGSGKIPKIGSSVALKGGNDGLSPSSAGTLSDADGGSSMRVTASSGGKSGNEISVKVEAATSAAADKFKLIVMYGADVKETFDELTIAAVENTVNTKSEYIRVEKDKWIEGGSEKTGSGKVPKSDQTLKLTGGKDDSSALQVEDFEGDEKAQNGLHAFDLVDDINIVAIPDRPGDATMVSKGLNYCEKNRKDCFFIADPPYRLSPTDVQDFRNATGAYQGNAFNSSYGALYYPWVRISDPLTGKNVYIPPSGTVAGTYAYTDSVRGVHKAPAGISEGKLGSVNGIERIITKSEHDGLNPIGINVIRSFPTSGICIWGARTLSADSEWKYINIRRLFLFLEKSIYRGTQWVVFEPNTPDLWGSVKRNLTAFLLMVWRDGALFGSTPEEAFFVKVDAENNPEEVRNAGRLIIEVGVAPARPAEFVIIRISQKTQSK